MARSVLILVLLAPAIAHAAARRSFVVVVAPAHDWRSDALAIALRDDLADDRLASHAPCEPKCSDAELAAANVDLVVRATLEGPTLAYELRALWPGAPPPVRGTLLLAGTDRVTVAGRLRDQLHRLARVNADETATDAGELALPGIPVIALGVLAVLALLASPLVIARDAWPAVRRAGIVVVALGAVAMLVPGRALYAAGGLAWGSFAARTVPVALPPLVGLGRIEYAELWRVLAGWSALAAQRIVALALLYAPLALAAWWLTDDLVLAVPLVLLVARAWIRIAIAALAERLDGQLADRAADRPAWHAAVRAYVVGYLTRNGLPIDRELLDRIAIVPGNGDEVYVYGGGATHTRIVVPRKMLELALAPPGRPHDYAAPRVSTLHWTEWNAGLVVATEQGESIATREQRQPREVDPEVGERLVLGEPVTLAGIIEPTALDERTAYRPHDDPVFLDWDPGEEYDGTDAGDRDFLFGVAIHAIGMIHRHGDRIATLAVALRRWRIGRWIEQLPDAVGDDHTAVLGARDHLVQYLGWQLWRREDLLTARAYAPELDAMSKKILALAAGEKPSRPRKRLLRLAAAPVRWRRYALAAVIAAGASGIVFAVVDAVRYHPTYVERMSKENDHGKVP